MTLIRRNRRKPNAVRFQLLWNRISLHPNEVGLIATLAAITGYMLWVSPEVLMTATVMGLIAIAFGLLNRSAQSVAGFGLPIQGWHLASVVIAVSAVAGMGAIDPVSAQMFNNLETAVNDAINNTNSPNSGYKTCDFKAPLPSLGEGFGVRAKCSGKVQNWYNTGGTTIAPETITTIFNTPSPRRAACPSPAH